MRYASINDPTVIIGYATHPGKAGKNNEDDFALFETPLPDGAIMPVALVADGIGGNMAGETASHLTAQTFHDTFRGLSQTPPRRRLLDAIETANRVVYDRALDDPNLQGMGTTVVATALLGHELFVAHAGDSRAYLIRNGRAFQLTADHTWAQEAIEAGRLTPDQARAHPNRHVIKRFLGIAPDVDVDTDVLEVTATPSNPDQLHLLRKLESIRTQPGDIILLCSDGLTDVVSDKQIEQTLKQYGLNLQDAANHLIELANKAGGPDNITVVMLQRREPGAPPVATVAGTNQQRSLLGILLTVALALVVGAVALIYLNPFSATPAVTATATSTPLPAIPAQALAVITTSVPSATVASVDTPAASALVSATTALTLTQTPAPTLADISTLDPVSTTLALAPTGTTPLGAVTSTPTTTLTSATRPPTSTPVPELATDTPTPTETVTATNTALPNRPTSITQTSPAQQSTRTGAGNNAVINVRLISPNEGDTVEGGEDFTWQPDSALPPGYRFEPVFWTGSQDPLSDGRGWGGSTLANTLKIDLTEFPEVQSGTYKWGVLLVEVDPYTRINLVSGIHNIIVQRRNDSSDDQGSSGGPQNPNRP